MLLISRKGKGLLDLRSCGLVYLATPYTKYPDGMDVAFEAAAIVAGRLMKERVKVYSPVAHTHPLATYAKIDPTDRAIWLPGDEAMMQACHLCAVAELPGWHCSSGVARGIEWFTLANKPVVYLDPDRLVVRATPGAVVYSPPARADDQSQSADARPRRNSRAGGAKDGAAKS
jgi:hypothetical protein